MEGHQTNFQTCGELHPVGTRSRRNQILLHQTPYGKTVLEPLQFYGFMLNLDVLSF